MEQRTTGILNIAIFIIAMVVTVIFSFNHFHTILTIVLGVVGFISLFFIMPISYGYAYQKGMGSWDYSEFDRPRRTGSEPFGKCFWNGIVLGILFSLGMISMQSLFLKPYQILAYGWPILASYVGAGFFTTLTGWFVGGWESRVERGEHLKKVTPRRTKTWISCITLLLVVINLIVHSN